MSDEPKLTPMMQRYLEVKRQHPDAILLFRMGDFYELFYADAQTAARVLGLTLTSRDKGSPQPVPMAGFPYHALDNYLRSLEAEGAVAGCAGEHDTDGSFALVLRQRLEEHIDRAMQGARAGLELQDALVDGQGRVAWNHVHTIR